MATQGGTPLASSPTGTPQNKFVKRPYTVWLNSAGGKKRVIDILEREGFPLEDRIKTVLRKSNYHVSHSYYKDWDKKRDAEITREIDIVANKDFLGFSLHGCRVNVHLHIIGDCKKSAVYDYFGFPKDPLTLSYDFPFIHNFKEFFGNGVGIEKLFKFPLVIQNITKVAEDGSPSQRDSEVDSIYDGCEQILKASEYFRRATAEKSISKYKIIHSNPQIVALFDAYITKNGITAKRRHGVQAYDRLDIDGFLRDPATLKSVYSAIGQVNVHLGVPLLVVDENNGLFEVEMKNGRINDILDKGYGLYLYPPSSQSSVAALVGYSGYFPVVICNEKSLADCLTVIEDGVTEMINHAQSALDQIPTPLYWEIYDAVVEAYSADTDIV